MNSDFPVGMMSIFTRHNTDHGTKGGLPQCVFLMFKIVFKVKITWIDGITKKGIFQPEIHKCNRYSSLHI
jgi:hypothetical protein